MTDKPFYPIGTPGVAWGDAEKAQWLATQKRQRNYQDDVLSVVSNIWSRFEAEQYTQLDYDVASYPLFALKSKQWDDKLPIMLVTGGVHGYETSGVHGALRFADLHAGNYEGRANLIIVPCVSPWAYDVINRWNPYAIDPNRSFYADSPAPESKALWDFITPWRDKVTMHIDLHETTDSDESEFRPALAAHDGTDFEPGIVPDGFYLCGDKETPQPAFQQAVIEAVAKVTHIAPADDNNEIIGSPEVARGVIQYPLQKWHLCAGITNARYRTTTEVYPDSPTATPEECNVAQATAVCAAIDYALANPVTR
ncbi:MAG TPA: M14 family metallocarboxypeptidase [Oleiagrimonas sp.]|nr:M14 family metallocarboxypeptidase [Oleiagrimonas sp.]